MLQLEIKLSENDDANLPWKRSEQLKEFKQMVKIFKQILSRRGDLDGFIYIIEASGLHNSLKTRSACQLFLNP